MKSKFVIYTALFGDYDDLIEPIEKIDGCDYICFTDQIHLDSKIWTIKIVKEYSLSTNMMNRKLKLLPHLFLSNYEWSMYIDSNIGILGNPLELGEKYLKNFDLIMPKHFARNCLYAEGKACVLSGKTNYFETRKQLSFYRRDGYIKDFGLSENNIILRRHNEEAVIQIMDNWWSELNSWTKRDQLSLGYVLWKNKKNFNYMDESARNNTYFSYVPHKHYFKSRTFLSILKNQVRKLFFLMVMRG